jgi:ATP-dependent Clp protease ATP-binding subunit ClpA
VFASFTKQGNVVAERAKNHATRLGRSLVGTEHFLLAIGDTPECAGARVLERLGWDKEAVRTAIRSATGSSDGETSRHSHDKELTMSLGAAMAPAAMSRLPRVGTHCILYGIVGDGETRAADALSASGVDHQSIRVAVEAAIQQGDGDPD